jgi:hypothetical protein
MYEGMRKETEEIVLMPCPFPRKVCALEMDRLQHSKKW